MIEVRGEAGGGGGEYIGEKQPHWFSTHGLNSLSNESQLQAISIIRLSYCNPTLDLHRCSQSSVNFI